MYRAQRLGFRVLDVGPLPVMFTQNTTWSSIDPFRNVEDDKKRSVRSRSL